MYLDIQQNSPRAVTAFPIVVYPSPVFLAAPLLIAIALISGGVARGGLQTQHSTPALILMALTYGLSRWYRRAHVVFQADHLRLRDRTVFYDDISAIRHESGDKQRAMMLNLYDKNAVKRLSIPLNAYGTGQRVIIEQLRCRLPKSVSLEVSVDRGRRIYVFWTAMLIVVVLAVVESFGGFV